MRKQKPERAQRVSKSKSSLHKIPTFTEIGGSPVPGLTLRHVFRGHTQWLGRIAWSPDGRYLASPSADNTVQIWDTHAGVCVFTLRWHKSQVNSVAWSPDSRHLASASGDKTICIWEVGRSRPSKIIKKHTDSVLSVAWSPDQRLASASSDETIRIWEGETGEHLHTLKGHTEVLTSVAWSPDGKHLASSSTDGTIRVWDAHSSKSLRILKGNPSAVYCVAWLQDGETLICSGERGVVSLWNISRGKCLQVLEGHVATVNCAVFSYDDRWLASKGSSDETVRLWRCDTWACVAELEEPASGMWPPNLAFHPRLPLLATLGENDTIIRIWELDEALLRGYAQESIHYTTAKLVLVGDSGVGKTGLGWRLAHGEFKEHASTHGQQFWPIQKLTLKRKDGTECEAVLWDLAGQHVYRQIHSIFLENVTAALVLFDPSNRHEPLKGVQFWLEQLKGKEQLPLAILVGARVDRGAPALSQQELDQFCQRYGIHGGYISTSAFCGEGLDALMDTLKAQIPWDELTATVTTVTFKRIKDHVLMLKEKPNRKGVLVTPSALRRQLKTIDKVWRFTAAEMMTAVGHLETHGYVAVLRSSAGEQHILLTPELLVTLASSIVLLADKHPRELGAVSETEILQDKFQFDELEGLSSTETQILLDAAILRFLKHNICFRETLNDETLLIFPGLINKSVPCRTIYPRLTTSLTWCAGAWKIFTPHSWSCLATHPHSLVSTSGRTRRNMKCARTKSAVSA